MASPSADQRKAILGYRGGAPGEQGHEEIMAHLEKIFGEFKQGRKGDEDSPGRREAAAAAFAKEIPSERGHEGGDNNVVSNDPHKFGAEYAGHADGPAVIAPGGGHPEHSRLTHTAGVESRGQQISAKPSGGYPGGQVSFRTIAARRAGDQMREPSKTSEGNKTSNPAGPAAPEGAKVGEAPAPSKAGPDKTTGDYEKVPSYVAKESLGKDEWARAAEGVRKLLRAPKR